MFLSIGYDNVDIPIDGPASQQAFEAEGTNCQRRGSIPLAMRLKVTLPKALHQEHDEVQDGIVHSQHNFAIFANVFNHIAVD